MTQQEFVAKIYELLEAKGHVEINGELYYPESAIMSAFEWIKEHSGKIIEVDTSKILADLTKKLSDSIIKKF